MRARLVPRLPYPKAIAEKTAQIQAAVEEILMKETSRRHNHTTDAPQA
ncbi:hypothetical protein SLH49_18305 [Cognatiyoonia sp. IB215446]|nr:hypothetical protein [Cognatiyoonia sp. IB215446]MDX8349945.1 hypothetical protein [Cognatiyoonia sp. IB215446]